MIQVSDSSSAHGYVDLNSIKYIIAFNDSSMKAGLTQADHCLEAWDYFVDLVFGSLLATPVRKPSESKGEGWPLFIFALCRL